MRFKTFICASLIAVGLLSCDFASVDESDPVLAEVGDQELRLSRVLPQIDTGGTPEDSISQLRSYVQYWVREAILLNEAEKNLPPDLDINDLVLDYRHSLLISNFEKNLVETQLDTVITARQLENYYARNKEQYQLERPIVRGKFVKLSKELDSLDHFREWWDSDEEKDAQKLHDYSLRKAEVFLLEDSTWYKVDDIESLVPPGTLSSQNMKPNTSLRFSDDEYEYYLMITESVLSREIAPLSYIREQAVRFIMHKRKLELLESIKSDLYEREMNSGNVKINVQ